MDLVGRETACTPNSMIALPSGIKPVNKVVVLRKLRPNGFVSIAAGNEIGVLASKPFHFNSDRLMVNADAGDGGLTGEMPEYRKMSYSVDVAPIGDSLVPDVLFSKAITLIMRWPRKAGRNWEV